MRHSLLLSILILGISFGIKAQSFPSWYLVSFKDKNNSPYSLENPEVYLSQRAIERRKKNNIKIDSSDFPVNSFYLDTLRNYGVEITYQSRWMNAAMVYVDDATKLLDLKQSTIVDSVAFMAPFISLKVKFGSKKSNKRMSESAIDTSNISSYSETSNRIHSIGLQTLMDMGYRGKDVQIAVMDNGFNNVNKLAGFQHLFSNGQILGYHNFTTDGKDVFKSGIHGTMVLSTMAGYEKEEFIGSAVDADYYLLQTEDNRSEFPVEEANYLFGAEYADSVGVDIITSSLVYTKFDSSKYNHNISQLDGKTALVSRAAQMAAEKGILVFNSAGNEGTNSWRKICFPADAEDVIAVAAVDKNDEIASFSSQGYSADGRVKPDVAARGEKAAVINPQGKIYRVNGTSFSTPFTAGATASLMQAATTKTSQEIRNAIKESARQFLYPDSLYGYGIPNFYLAAILLNVDSIENIEDTQEPVILPNPFDTDFYILYKVADSQEINISIYDVNGKEIWRKENVQSKNGKNLFYINDISSFAQGIYFVKMKIGESSYTKKIIKR